MTTTREEIAKEQSKYLIKVFVLVLISLILMFTLINYSPWGLLAFLLCPVLLPAIPKPQRLGEDLSDVKFTGGMSIAFLAYELISPIISGSTLSPLWARISFIVVCSLVLSVTLRYETKFWIKHHKATKENIAQRQAERQARDAEEREELKYKRDLATLRETEPYDTETVIASEDEATEGSQESPDPLSPSPTPSG